MRFGRRGTSTSKSPNSAAILMQGRSSTVVDISGNVTYDYYISTSGSDGNPGTQVLPWAITALNTKRSTYAGKRVGILPGTYDCSAMPDYQGYSLPSPRPVFYIAPGNASANTVIQSTVPRAAVINMKSAGGARNIVGPMGQFRDIGYVTLSGLRFTGGGSSCLSFYGISNTDYNNMLKNLIIEYCQFDDFYLVGQDNHPSVWMSDCINPIYRNNLLFEFRSSNPNDLSGQAVLVTSVRGLHFYFNEVYNTGCAIIDKHEEGTGGVANDAFLVECNYVHDVTGPLIVGLDNEYVALSAPGPYLTSVVRNNLMVNCLGGNFGTKINSPTRMRVEDYNNTFVHTSNLHGDAGVETFASSATQFTLSSYNNINYSNGATRGYTGDRIMSTGCAGVIGYNCYDAVTQFQSSILSPINVYNGTAIVTSYTTLAAWQAALLADGAPIGGRDENSILANPNFVGGVGVNAYKITSGPCFGTGLGGKNMGCWDGVVTQMGPDWR